MTLGKIGARNLMNSAWVNPYVTNGLVAMWDGIWNVGGGLAHDSNAKVWYDCIHGYPILFQGNNVKFSSNGLVRDMNASNFSGVIMGLCGGDDLDYGWKYCELVLEKVDNLMDFGIVLSFKDRGLMLYKRTSSISAKVSSAQSLSFPGLDFSNAPIKMAISFSYPGTSTDYKDADNVWLNGNSNGTQSGQSDSWANFKNNSGTISTLYNNTNGYNFNGIYYAIRLYNRVLTQSEIDANYATDVQRFNLTGGGLNV